MKHYYARLKIANKFVNKLNKLGIKKFIVHELPDNLKDRKMIASAVKTGKIKIVGKIVANYRKNYAKATVNVYKVVGDRSGRRMDRKISSSQVR